MNRNNSQMTTQPTDVTYQYAPVNQGGYQYSQANQANYPYGQPAQGAYQYAQQPVQDTYQYANYRYEPLGKQSRSRDSKGAVVAIVALAVIVASIVAFLILDPLKLFDRGAASTDLGTAEQPAGNATAISDTAVAESGDSLLNINVGTINSDNFPNIDTTVQISSDDPDFASSLSISSLSVIERESNGNEHTCSITGLIPANNSGSYKLSYTSSLATKDGSTRTVRVLAKEGSGFTGWGETSYVTPKEEAAQNQADPTQNTGGNTTININMPDGTTTTTNTNGTTTTSSSDYILPYSDTHEYLASELTGLTKRELWLARNEIYARHGRKFNDQELQDYFNSKSWYVPLYSPEYFDANIGLNSVETKNVNTILSLE